MLALLCLCCFALTASTAWFARRAWLWRSAARAWHNAATRRPRQPALTVVVPRAYDVHSRKTVVGTPVFEVEDSDFI